jgi:hypothetical protein
MAKRLQIAPHLPVAELERRYRQASEGIERSHYQIIWLLAQGRKSEDVATLTSYSRLWIYESDTPGKAGGLMSRTAPRAGVLAESI